MKTIEINFRIDGYCAMLLDVPDDYVIPSTNQQVFWEDLKEKVGDQIEVDPFKLDGSNWNLPQGSYFQIMQVDNVEILYMSLHGEDGFEYETKLDEIPFYR
jgi:hypothetical protein